MPMEYPDAFVFEFDILFRSYNYTEDGHKLNLFPTTLKYFVLRWFMGLEDESITTWENMKSSFLEKYHDYCRNRNEKEDIFNMMQKEDEKLEEFVERFLYNLQKTRHIGLNEDTINTLFLRGIRDEYLDVLNLMGARDISKLPLAYIYKLCIKYSCSKSKSGKGVRDSWSRVTKSATRGVTRVETGNLLHDFKTELLCTISSQINTLKLS